MSKKSIKTIIILITIFLSSIFLNNTSEVKAVEVDSLLQQKQSIFADADLEASNLAGKFKLRKQPEAYQVKEEKIQLSWTDMSEYIKPQKLADVAKVGDYVGYSAGEYNNWRVLKNDGKTVTLISEGVVAKAYAGGEYYGKRGSKSDNHLPELDITPSTTKREAGALRVLFYEGITWGNSKITSGKPINSYLNKTYATSVRMPMVSDFNAKWNYAMTNLPNWRDVQTDTSSKEKYFDYLNGTFKDPANRLLKISEGYYIDFYTGMGSMTYHFAVCQSDGVHIKMTYNHKQGHWNKKGMYYTYGLRPVVTLKTDLLTYNGNGTKGSPWQLAGKDLKVSYTVKQKRNDGTITRIEAGTNVSKTITKANGLKDIAAPTRPVKEKITSVKEDKNTLNIKVNSTDNGTKYEHYVELAMSNTKVTAPEVVFVIDVSKYPKGYWRNIIVKKGDEKNGVLYKTAEMFVQSGIKVGFVTFGSRTGVIQNPTLDLNAILNKSKKIGQITHAKLWNGINPAVDLFSSTSINKSIILSTDGGDENCLKQLSEKGIDFYAVLRSASSSTIATFKKYGTVINSKTDYDSTMANFVKMQQEIIKKDNGTVKSNTVTTLIQTEVAKYAYVIDKKSTTEPDTSSKSTLYADSSGNIKIPKSYANQGYYIHIKAIDGAGNASSTLHLKIEYIEKEITLYKNYQVLSGEDENTGIVKNPGWNYVDLNWKLEEIDVNKIRTDKTLNGYEYIIYRKSAGETNFGNPIEVGAVANKRYEEARDNKGPDAPLVTIAEIEGSDKLEFNVRSEDVGNIYEFYVEAIAKADGDLAQSNTVIQEVKTGLKGFAWSIDDNESSDPGATVKSLPELTKADIGKWLHIRGVDHAGNLGEIRHVKIEPGRKIPFEDLDKTNTLYCIANNVMIPAIDGYTDEELNSTIKLETGETIRVDDPKEGDIIGRVYKENISTNIYKKTKRSQSIGRYVESSDTPKIQEGKEGNASEYEAYILAEYEANTSSTSSTQYAMYLAEISQKYNDTQAEIPSTDESDAIVQEAQSYENYRKAKYKENTNNENLDAKVYMNEDYSKILIGKFKLEYNPSGIKVNGSNRPEVYFGRIIGAKLYDQNGNIVGEKDINGNTIGSLKWEFEYVEGKPGALRKNSLFTYSKYKFPVGNEEFYVKIDTSTLPAGITGISKIEFIHQELIADAKYRVLRGTYNKIEWRPNILDTRSQDVVWCTEAKTQGKGTCIHGKTYDHIQGAYCYLTAHITGRGETSQALLELSWAKKYTETFTQVLDSSNSVKADSDTDSDNPEPDNPNPDNPKVSWEIVMGFAGGVWNDGMEDQNDGIRVQGETGIEKVKVTFYRVDRNHKRLGESYSTYTDANGDYTISNLIIGIYDVEFEYDGQTYTTTKFLVSGDAQELYEQGITDKYKNDSMAKETKEERQNFNNKFEEICGDTKARGTAGALDLEYSESDSISSLITLEDDKTTKDIYKLRARTSENDVYYPTKANNVTINGEGYITVSKINNMNLGLAKRQQTDENLKADVYETTLSIKGIKQSFIHAQRNLKELGQEKEIEEYIQYINRADYDWSWQENYNKFGDSFKDVWESAESSELEGYVDYMIIIRNHGEKDYVKITELADYYSKDLIYSNDGYRDFDITSWAYLKKDDITESENSYIEKIDKVTWRENSKYGTDNPYSEYFNKIYTTDLEKLELKKGEYIELHIVFKIAKDNEGRLKLNQTQEGKENVAEINGYKTYYIDTREVAGLVDKDSRPGNLNPLMSSDTYEDDEDKAPNYKLFLDSYSGGNSSGDENSSEDSSDNSTDGEDNVNRDENGNIIGYGNVIDGNVWEDLKTQNNLTLNNRQIIGDGIRQDGEPLVQNVKVELVEIFENPKTGAKFETVVREQKTRNLLSISNDAKLDGGYSFTNLPTGKYKVKFTYGTEEQLMENTKYNGQDYQGVATEDIYKNEVQGDYSDIEIMLALDVSESMTGGKIEATKKSANELVEKLMEKLPGVKIGVVSFNEYSQTKLTPDSDKIKGQEAINSLTTKGETSIGGGIQAARDSYSTTSLRKIMVLLTDGLETVENEEKIANKIEKMSDIEGIEIISILTQKAESIFGTEEQPRRGSLYYVTDATIEETITNKVYEAAVEASKIKKNRSVARDIVGDENIPGTRKYNMALFKEIGAVEGKILAIEEINNLEGQEREERVRELASKTYMMAETEDIVFKPYNSVISHVEQLNLGLRERPKTELTLDTEILGIKVMLSDGNVIIDTEKGMSKNVNGLTEIDTPISIFMDEEIMHGATITVKYKVILTNTGEIDRISNYYIEEGQEESANKTVTTSAEIMYNYTGKNMLYKAEEQEDDIWEEIKTSDIGTSLQEDVLNEISEQNRKVYKTEAFLTPLYPVGSIEAEQGEATSIEKIVVLSKVISAQDEEDILTYDSSMEIIKRTNDAGRRSTTSIPGNYVPGSKKLEPDSGLSRRIVITEPLGGNKDSRYYVIGVLSLIMVAGGIYLLREKVVEKAKDEKKNN